MIRIVIAFLLVALLTCSVIGALASWVFAAFLFGGITLGPILTTLVRQIGEHRAGRSLDVFGRDVQVPLPKAVAVPTSWRRKHKEQWPS